MKYKIDFFIVNGPNNKGLPYPDEVFNPDDLNDPKALRDLLGAEAIAKKMLPFVDTRARHWRYYLLLAPQDHGRKINIENRLQGIKTITGKGIGSRSTAKKLEPILYKDYRTAASIFWKANTDTTLLRKAKSFRSKGNLKIFFQKLNDNLQKRFHKALTEQSPKLSKFLLHKKNQGDDILFTAVLNSSSSRNISIDEKKLLFAWALLQALYGIRDFEDEENQTEEKKDDLRKLAKTCLEYIKNGTPVTGELSDRQITYIRNLLEHAIGQQDYSPPIKISSKKSDGTKRRVFSSLRLRIYTRLLTDTLPS